MPIQVLNFQIDTEVLNVHGKLSPELAGRLDELKHLAAEVEADIETEWNFQGQQVFIKPHGAGRQWRWILYCQDLHIDVGKGKFNGIMAKVRLSSLLLHAQGPDGALNTVYGFLVSLFGETFALQVSEVHLCLDITGWDMSLEDAQGFVSRGRSKKAQVTEDDDDEDMLTLAPDVTFSGRKVNQFDFSKTAPHSCCIYDKTKEVKTHHNEWFHAIWKANGWDGESRVIRIEFRYERECLRDMQVECPFVMLDQLDAMWAYSTQKWLRHCVPDGGKNQSRWKLSAVWQVVQNPGGNHEAQPIARAKKVELDAERAKAGFVGYATSWAVREVFRFLNGDTSEHGDPLGLPLDVVEDDGAGFFAWAFDPVKAYLDERKEATFIDVMQAKARKLGLKLAA